MDVYIVWSRGTHGTGVPPVVQSFENTVPVAYKFETAVNGTITR